MSYCLNPGCKSPQNSKIAKQCESCGWGLLLQQRYRAIKAIGQGGFGRTFLAVDKQLPSKPPCVIKQFSFHGQSAESTSNALRLFRQEAQRLDRLGQHPQIPQLLAYFQDSGQSYLVQEYIEGMTLKEEIQKKGTFGENQIWQLLRELLPVLKFVHQHQIIHRDLKPANIMRRTTEPFNYIKTEGQKKQKYTGKTGEIVLIDFGVAKLLTGSAIFQTGTIIGSAEYMAPEQTRGKVLPASDLFSLGVTCIYLLTDVAPWDMYDLANDRWAWRDFLPSGKSTSERLGRILDKLLAHSTSDRYQSAEQVLQAMKPPKQVVAQSANRTKTTFVSRNQNSSNLTSASRAMISRVIPGLAPQPTSNELASAKGIDYTNLQYLLATRSWKEADLETWLVLSLAAGKTRKSYLFADDIDRLVCRDLQTIDRLWLKYSGGRFGFSVQAKIYQQVKRDYGRLCERLGWQTYNTHHPADGFQFKLSAPIGHLPSRMWSGGTKWWVHIEAMVDKLVKCGIISC
jgi:serine/threonine protein kinase